MSYWVSCGNEFQLQDFRKYYNRVLLKRNGRSITVRFRAQQLKSSCLYFLADGRNTTLLYV